VQVARVEPGGGQQVGEELGVHPVAVPAAELVELHRHQGSLGLPGKPRDDPRVRVSLLEVVDRPVHEVLADLLGRAAVAQSVGHTVARNGFHQ
jgi:hypothetical protein